MVDLRGNAHNVAFEPILVVSSLLCALCYVCAIYTKFFSRTPKNELKPCFLLDRVVDELNPEANFTKREIMSLMCEEVGKLKFWQIMSDVIVYNLLH